MVRTKKKELPRGAGSEDRKRFETARSYMVRVDELVACRNIRCRKRFELTGQSVVLTSEGDAQQPAPNFDSENFGNRSSPPPSARLWVRCQYLCPVEIVEAPPI